MEVGVEAHNFAAEMEASCGEGARAWSGLCDDVEADLEGYEGEGHAVRIWRVPNHRKWAQL